MLKWNFSTTKPDFGLIFLVLLFGGRVLESLFCLQIPLWPGWLPRGSQGPPWDSLGPPWDFLGTPWDTSWTQKLTFWSEKLGNFENLWKPSGTFEDLRGPSGTFGNPLKPSETAKKIMKHWQIKISRFGQKQKMRNSELGPNL